MILLQLAGIFSLVTFVGSLIGLPWLIGRMPEDYFLTCGRARKDRSRRSFGALFAVILRNIVGGLLFLAGIAMLVLPGQGVLTIIIGLSLMDVPGKGQVLARWSSNRRVQDMLNWIRRRQGKTPFCFTRAASAGKAEQEKP